MSTFLPFIPGWSPDPLYPAGSNSWSGHPTKVAPSYRYLTPGTPPTAQEMNYLLNGASLATNGAISGALDNWPNSLSATAFTTGTPAYYGIYYDAVIRVWVLGANNGSSTGVAVSGDNGAHIATAATSPSSPIGLAANAGIIVQIAVGDFIWRTVSGSTTSSTIADTLTRNTGTVWWSAAEALFYAYLVQNVSGTLSNGTLVSTPDGSTLTQHAVSGGWLSGTNHPGQILFAQSPMLSVIAMCGVTAGADTARLATIRSGTLTDISPSTLTGNIITGLAYDSVNGYWLLTLYNGTSTTLSISSDLVNWTTIKTYTAQKVGPVATVGTFWCVSAPPVSAYESSSLARVQYSPDIGQTWYSTAEPLISTASGFVALVAGDNRLAHCGVPGGGGAGLAQFSQCVG